MTMPGQGRGQPPFDQIAQDAIAATRPRPRIIPPEFAPPLTPAEKAEAEQVKAAKAYCGFCAGSHAMPGTAACPRLASVELDGDGKVRSATFWKGRAWAKGRVVFIEDQLAEDGDD